ncbi:MAG: response regulator [Imperialibacter sp.]|uniref:response regulator n=1 Tax=Imperialibacter sp. TaxID=2038411 RepID=UPI0032F0657D
MATLDKVFLQSQIDKNIAEAERNNAEKLKAEFEVKSMKYTFWLKPIIGGLAVGVAFIPIYYTAILPSQEAQIIQKELTNKRLEQKLFHLEMSLDSSMEAFEEERSLVNNQLETIEGSMKKKDSILSAYIVELTRLKSTNPAMRDSLNSFLVKKKNRILWVDDQPANNDPIASYMQRQGAVIVKALSTDEAIDFIKTQHFDYIISDMSRLEDDAQNPKAGLDLLTYLKKARVKTPLAFYSGSGVSQRDIVKAADKQKVLLTNDSKELFGFLGF